MQLSSATLKNVGIGLRKIVTCSHSSLQCPLVSTVFGTVSSLHPTSFLMLVSLIIVYPGLALTVARGEISRYNKYSYVYAHAYLCPRIKTEVVKMASV